MTYSWLCVLADVSGNALLADLGFLLDVQIESVYGTYVSNNSRLCSDASIRWTRRNDSFVEFELGQVCDCVCCRHCLMVSVWRGVLDV